MWAVGTPVAAIDEGCVKTQTSNHSFVAYKKRHKFEASLDYKRRDIR